MVVFFFKLTFAGHHLPDHLQLHQYTRIDSMKYGCDVLCSLAYKTIEEKRSDKERLKKGAMIKAENISLQNINQLVSTRFPGEATVFSRTDKI